ncbi:TPA: hypothetical protein ACH3X3_005060 [Trebouxia sp. C0006]
MAVVVRTIGISLPFFSTLGTANHIKDLTLQVVDMPLLFETGSHKVMWPRVFVTCSHETEVERLMKRDACSKPQAEAKVKAQMRLKLKKDRSQIVIDNSGDKHHCEQQVQQLVRQLQGKYKWLGVATSPVVFVGVVWLLLRVLRLSSA